MAKTSEGSFSPENGVSLYTKTWQAANQPRAILAFVHGFSDHSNAYYSLFPLLTSHDIEIHAFDQRGWGRSVSSPASSLFPSKGASVKPEHPICLNFETTYRASSIVSETLAFHTSANKVPQASRGLTGPTSTVLSDLSAFLSSISSSSSSNNAPLFLMGHSMGGAEVLSYMLSPVAYPDRVNIRGYLAEAPYIALHPSSQPHAVTVYAGKLAAKILPHRQMVQKMDSSLMSRDPNVCKEWENDELCHDTGTLEGLAGMLGRAAELEGKTVVEAGGQSVWIGHGSEDRVCSFQASRKFFEALTSTDKEFKVYDGGYHKLHAEPDGMGASVAKDVADWILARSGEDGVRDFRTGCGLEDAKARL